MSGEYREIIAHRASLLSTAFVAFCARGQKFVYVTSTGEKVLRFEFMVAANLPEAWKLFTPQRLKKWAAQWQQLILESEGNCHALRQDQGAGDPGTISFADPELS